MCDPIARGVRMTLYRKPYSEWVDRTYEFPRGYKMPDFSLFNGEREQSTIEHVLGLLRNVVNLLTMIL